MKCLTCNTGMTLVQGTLAIARRHLGSVSIPGCEWHECPKCGERMYPDNAATAIDRAFQDKLAQLVLGRPFTDLVEEKEVAEILEVSVQAVNKNKGIRGGLIWKATRNGKTWYLRKSVELFKETGDGRFSLVRSRKNSRATRQQPSSAHPMLSHTLSPKRTPGCRPRINTQAVAT